MKSLGSMDQILGMLPIPGVSKSDREQMANVGEAQMKKIEACVNSMTVKERQKPDIIDASRKRRIAAGSGIPLHELNRFLKDFENMRKMMRKMTEGMKSGKNPLKGMNLPPGMRGKFPGF